MYNKPSNNVIKKKSTSSGKNPFFSEPVSDTPLDPEHGGPILCMDVKNDMVVTGSTDHGLRCYSLSNGKQLRQLYNKQYGHTEWVTTCAIMNDGKIVSGGMDSTLCVWDAKAVKCGYIKEHTESISKVMVDDYNICLSASYDSTIRISDLNSGASLGILKGVHKKAVTEFEWNNSLCVSGGRDGSVVVWDINKEKSIAKYQNHAGQIGKIKLHSDGISSNTILSCGLNDGVVNVYDMNSNKRVMYNVFHSSSINFMETNLSNLIITGSSDKTIKLIDMTANLQVINTLQASDSINCGDVYNNFCAVGCADGNMLAFDLDTGTCLYGFGVDNKGTPKCLKIIPDKGKIIAGGDNAQGMMLNYF